MMRISPVGISIAVLVLACSKGPSTRPEPSTGRDPYLIVQSELETVPRDNLYDAVRQLRPGWFTRRVGNRTGEEVIIVYLDDRQIGSVGNLRRFSAQSVQSVKYLSPTEAQVRYGQINQGRPAIQVELLREH